MRTLRLYRSEPRVASDECIALDRDTQCTRCALHRCVTSRCIAADGAAGGLVIVGDGPTDGDMKSGRPFSTAVGMYVRRHVDAIYSGPSVYTYATRCPRDDVKIPDRFVKACRPYLAAVLREASPTRVIALGPTAFFALTGRKVAIMSVERAYTYLYNCGEDPVPCYLLPHPMAANRNTFVGNQFVSTLKWAIKGKLPEPPPLGLHINLCRGPDETDEAIARLNSADIVSFDVETFGRQYSPEFRVLSLAITRVDTLETFQWDEETLEDEFTLGRLIHGTRKPSPLVTFLESEAPIKAGHFRTYDCTSLDLRFKTRVRGPAVDTRIWHKLQNAQMNGRATLAIVSEECGMGGAKDEMKSVTDELVKPVLSALKSFVTEKARIAEGRQYRLSKKMRANRARLLFIEKQYPDVYDAIQRMVEVRASSVKGKKSKAAEPEAWSYGLVAAEKPADLARYNCRDTVATARIVKVKQGRFAKTPDLDAFREAVPDRAERAVERVQRWGIPTNLAAIQAFDTYLTAQLAPLERWFTENALNPNAHADVSAYLFTKLGITPPKILESGNASSDASVLEGLRHDHPVVQKILDFRKYEGFRTKYARGMLPWIFDGRVHPTIWLDGARTGRTSCSDPPLQQIPSPKKGGTGAALGKMARSIFAAEPGFDILSLDYSQLELRVAALLSGDQVMQQIFRDGVDYHKRTAELICMKIWGVTPDKITPWMREVAKTLNFSMLYGAGDRSVAAKLSIEAAKQPEKQEPITEEMVGAIRKAVLSKYKGLDTHIKRVVEEARTTGEVRTWWDGRPAGRRQLWDIAEAGDSKEARKRRSAAERAAFNTGVQGTANYFCIASMAAGVEWIEKNRLERDVQIVLTVHDQILFHTRKSLTAEVAAKAKSIMTGFNSEGVPLTVDIEIGDSWGTLEKVKAAA